jgi:antagonist of KipI
MSLRVHEAGLLSLLVDLGRLRSRHLGVPLGGAADRAALALGNALVGSPPGAVAVEMTLAGPTLEALQPVACVIFGAAFEPAVNGRGIAVGTTFTLEPGDVLRAGGTRRGARAYLCIAGGFDSPEVLGSRSALEPLRAGDELRCRASRTEARSLALANPTEGNWRLEIGDWRLKDTGRDSSQSSITNRQSEIPIRALDGPQREWFHGDAFFANEYEVTPASNRMGLRLKGEPLSRQPGELVSEAVAPGAVQVTNDGMPVVLGVDGQTIGGYPKVAHVIRADLDRLAQLRPGDRVRFARVTPEEAAAAARDRAAWLAAWLTRLRVAERAPRFV